VRWLGFVLALTLPLVTTSWGAADGPWKAPNLSDFESQNYWHGLTIRASNIDKNRWDFEVAAGENSYYHKDVSGLFRTHVGFVDLLGEGTDQLVVCVDEGGSSAFTECRVFAADPDLRLIYSTASYPSLGELEVADLDGDGVYEIGHLSYRFSFVFDTCNACSPRPRVIFRYDPTEGQYRPANWEFAHYVEQRIQQDLKMLQRRKQEREPFGNDAGGWIRGARLQVAIDWLYAGQDDEAWAFLAREEGVTEVPKREKDFLIKVLNDDPFYRDVRKRWAAAQKSTD